MKFKRIKDNTGINMIPLLDAIFILLIFFSVLLINVTINEKMNVKLPMASAGDDVQGDELVISIRANGEIYFDQRPVSIGDLRDKIKSGTGQSYTLRADRNVEFGRVVNVLDMLKENGIGDIGIEIQKH